MGSQSQGSHPSPLAIFQWSSRHSSQVKPITFGRHGHCPVILSQGPAVLFEPKMSHTQPARRDTIKNNVFKFLNSL